jgi:natural product precursor
MKKELKRLHLNKETLRNLNPSELQVVAGGATTTSDLCGQGTAYCTVTCPGTGGTVYCGGTTGGSAYC